MPTTIDFQLTKKQSCLDKIVLNEIVDKKRLKRLLNSNYLKITKDKDDKKQLEGYLKKVKDNIVQVKYTRKIHIGRVYANKTLSYQFFRKLVRHTLSFDNYTDLDITNAHPTMLYQITKQQGINNQYLEKYVKNRDIYIKEVQDLTNCNRDDAKELFIEIMYGKSIPKWIEEMNLKDITLPGFVYHFKEEMNKIAKLVKVSNNDFVKLLPIEKRNNVNSILSYYLQEHENRILEVIYIYLESNKYIKNNVATLCYDGIMINKVDKNEINDLCNKLNELVLEKTGFDLNFVEKVMDKVKYDIVEDANNDNYVDCEETDFMKMCEYMLEVSKKHNYKKDKIRVLKPCSCSPIVYEPFMEFEEFINFVFNKQSPYYKMFRKTSSYFKQLKDYLENIDDEELPFIKINKSIISFNNGYLDISNLYNITFNNFENINNDIITSVHHNLDFDVNILNMNIDDIKTPLFDKICSYHLEEEKDSDELLKIFYGMCGRLHYDINTYDKFNCMLFIKGGANTGKSTTGNILTINHQNIGTISGKMEGTFGLMSIYKKSLIYNPDMNKNFTEKVDKGDFQKIIEGSRLDIPIKNKGSINNFKWTSPMLFLANYFPEYKDSSGAIPRRLCVFFMDRFLENRDTSIEKRCIDNESHLILIKTLKCYIYIIKKFENKTYEDWGIEYFKRGYEEMTNKCNKLYEFLTLPPNDFEYWTIYKKGHITTFEDFKKAVKKFYYMNNYNDKFDLDKTTLGRCGYEIETINLCASCGGKPTGKRKKEEQCCSNYNSKNRRKKVCIKNMKIERKRYDIIEEI